MNEDTCNFIRQAAADPSWGLAHRESFGLMLHYWQRDQIPHLSAFCGKVRPRTLEEIPSVPVGLFKEGLDFCAGEPAHTFLTSGTTQGRRGAHSLPSLDAYNLGAELWWRAQVPGCPTRVISLVPSPEQAPESSLGHMVAHFASQRQDLFDMERGVDHAGCWAALSQASEPVFVAATAFSMAHLLEHPGQVQLPEGSVVMVTGGFKGRTTQLSAQQLRAEIPVRLGAPVVEEYGMTELSSQLWGREGRFVAPPWMKVYTVDPLTGTPTRDQGLLRFVDLANFGSCLSIETEDLGIVHGQEVTLLGRLSTAPHRGCSLSAEEAAQWQI